MTTIRWIARILSVASTALVLLFFIGEGGFGQPPQLSPRDVLLLACFPIGVTVGNLLAWRWEGLGGGIAVASLAAFYAIHFAFEGDFPRGPFFALFTLPGALFILCRVMKNTHQSKKPPPISFDQEAN